jgi:hypothetical protein
MRAFEIVHLSDNISTGMGLSDEILPRSVPRPGEIRVDNGL